MIRVIYSSVVFHQVAVKRMESAAELDCLGHVEIPGELATTVLPYSFLFRCLGDRHLAGAYGRLNCLG